MEYGTRQTYKPIEKRITALEGLNSYFGEGAPCQEESLIFREFGKRKIFLRLIHSIINIFRNLIVPRFVFFIVFEAWIRMKRGINKRS